MGFIVKLKDWYWWTKGEYHDWIRCFVNALPGSVGVKMRGLLLTRQFESCGDNIILHRNFRVNNPACLSIGNNFIANENCYINAGGRVIIGDDVMFGPDVKIWSVNHAFSKRGVHFNQQGYVYNCVKLGNNVWIGSNVFVAPGVDICDNVIVGAGAIVTKSITQPYSIVAGNPATVVKKIGSSGKFVGKN